jgi:hypothetical protein
VGGDGAGGLDLALRLARTVLRTRNPPTNSIKEASEFPGGRKPATTALRLRRIALSDGRVYLFGIDTQIDERLSGFFRIELAVTRKFR